jgi:hypothetical protein
MLPGGKIPQVVVSIDHHRMVEARGCRRKARAVTQAAAQTAQFLNSISDHRPYAAYHLIALRGARQDGELTNQLRRPAPQVIFVARTTARTIMAMSVLACP